jgi:hypothetical protein
MHILTLLSNLVYLFVGLYLLYEKKYGYELPKFFSKFRFDGKKKKGLYELACKKSGLTVDEHIWNKRKYRKIITEKINTILYDKN